VRIFALITTLLWAPPNDYHGKKNFLAQHFASCQLSHCDWLFRLAAPDRGRLEPVATAWNVQTIRALDYGNRRLLCFLFRARHPRGSEDR